MTGNSVTGIDSRNVLRKNSVLTRADGLAPKIDQHLRSRIRPRRISTKSTWTLAMIPMMIALSLLAGSIMVVLNADKDRQQMSTSTLLPHSPIAIDGDSNFTPANGVVGGNGIQGDPYVISGWEILSDSSIGIEINATSAFFIIEGCSIHGSLLYTGISLNVSANGVVRNVSSTMNLEGLAATTCSDIVIVDCNMSENVNCGIGLTNSNAIAISNCTITDVFYDGLGAIQIDGASNEIRIENNTLVREKGAGIRVDGSLYSSSIANNSIADCGAQGFTSSHTNTYDTSFADNEITGCYLSGINIGYGERNRVVRNSVSNSEGGILCLSSGTMIEWNTVTNCSVEAGISCLNYGNIIRNNTVSDCKHAGLAIDWNAFINSFGNIISDNTFVGDGVLLSMYTWGNRFDSNTVNGLPLVYLEDVHGYTVSSAGQVIAVDSTGVIVKDMDLSRSTVGVELLNCSESLIENVTVGDDFMGFYVANGSNRNEIVDCRITGSYSGVMMESFSSNNSVRQCNVTECTEGLGSVEWCSDNEFVGNEISRSGPGPSAVAIHVHNAPRIVIDSNRIMDTIYGVEIFPTHDYRVTNNTIVNSTGRGISLRNDCEEGLIANNTIFDCGYGITMSQQLIHEGPNNNLVTHNLIENASVAGIKLSWSFRNTVSENIVRNSTLGIHLYDTSHNYVFLNRFEDNADNALSEYTEGENYWNTSEQVAYEYGGDTLINYLGNFWDDYAGADSNGDGIGDTPYQVGDGYDNYPLASGVSVIPEFQSAWVTAAALIGIFLIAEVVQREKMKR